LKPFVLLEVAFQILYQIPSSTLHKNEDSTHGWQRIIGIYNTWDLDEDNEPIWEKQGNVLAK
jgi:hypothetical protein